MTDKLINRRQVEEQCGIGHAKLYALIRDGSFPPPCKVGRASRWRQSQIDAWIENLGSEKQGASDSASGGPA